MVLTGIFRKLYGIFLTAPSNLAIEQGWLQFILLLDGLAVSPPP
jgi:hypothetical protein